MPQRSLAPLLTATVYAVLATVWILASDLVVARLPYSHELQSIKGGLFVVVTAAILYLLLARHERRSHQLLDTATDAICMVDAAGCLRDANTAFFRQLGYTREEAATLRIAQWDCHWNAAAHAQRFSALQGKNAILPTLYRRKDGSQFDVELCMTCIELDSVPVLYCAARDITDRKTLEAKFLRAQRLESIGLLAGGIAHDLNNVLSPIVLGVGMLKAESDQPPDPGLVDRMESSAIRGAAIVKQILTFARGMDGERTQMDPRRLVEELSRFARETFPSNIEHRLEIAGDTSPVEADATQLEQVLLNLAVNARDAMPNGGVLTLRLRNHVVDEAQAIANPGAREGNYVLLAVEDTGEGMSPQVLEHLFEPFYTTKPLNKGTGLGLSTVHGIVRGHGGFVEVRSQPGQGAEFRVYLPAALRADGAAKGTERQTTIDGRAEHVLVADDEPVIREMTAHILRTHGFSVVIAADGQEALQLYRSRQGEFAFVLTDLAMPRMDGSQLAQEIRQHQPELPIIVMTGLLPTQTDDKQRRRLEAAEIRHILPKPFNSASLMQQVAVALEGPAVSADTERLWRRRSVAKLGRPPAGG